MVDTDRTLVRPELLRSVGRQLRNAREDLGWTRSQVVKRVEFELHVQTLATYEQGTRQCTLGRFVAICQALGVSALDVLKDAMEQTEVPPHKLVCAVDLRVIMAGIDPELEPLRRWARNRLIADSKTPVVPLEPDEVATLAMFCGLSHEDFFQRLTGADG